MRILVVTNLYPPHHIGGYELGCRDVVEGLRVRGHEVRVLTSTFRQGPDAVEELAVERALHFVGGPADGHHDKVRECRLLARALRRHRPDVVYFWNQAGLCHWVPMVAQALGYRSAFFLSDTHFVSWRIGAFLTRWALPTFHTPLARALRAIFGDTVLLRGWPVIHRQSCHFASRFLQGCAERAGLTIAAETSVVAHWGVDPGVFSTSREPRWPVRRLLYVGQLIPQKGVHRVIAALGLLAEKPGFAELSLTIAGGGLHPEYEQTLRALPGQLGIAGRVHFLGQVPRADLPRVYAEHDALIFPSEWDEPFAITPLEAMASGLAVVGTTTGGSGELFVERETALTFAAGDPADCARAIRELCADQQLCQQITRNGREQVSARYTLDRMVDAIEDFLQRAAPQRRRLG